MPDTTRPMTELIRETGPGLARLVAEAERTWRARGEEPGTCGAGWRPFEDAFPTFYQFTNRPR